MALDEYPSPPSGTDLWRCHKLVYIHYPTLSLNTSLLNANSDLTGENVCRPPWGVSISDLPKAWDEGLGLYLEYKCNIRCPPEDPDDQEFQNTAQSTPVVEPYSYLQMNGRGY